jgi:hypothetical protein
MIKVDRLYTLSSPLQIPSRPSLLRTTVTARKSVLGADKKPVRMMVLDAAGLFFKFERPSCVLESIGDTLRR